ncbi:MAG: N-acetylmuramoyl-L-alanine amidase [Planctomycetota bacterium]
MGMLRSLLALLCVLCVACVVPEKTLRGPRLEPVAVASPQSEPQAETRGEEIVACGQRIAIGTRVVLWDEPGGYSAYSDRLHFAPPTNGSKTPEDGRLRYEGGRATKGERPVQLVEPGSMDLNELRAAVDLFVVHYDVAGTAARCFLILQDRRCLSVHFLLDVDGTIYQTLDLRERAWHAGTANTRSVGVEIANIGSRRVDDAKGMAEIDRWYTRDGSGLRYTPPNWVDLGTVRTPGFVGYAARDERLEGWIQGELRAQYDFTPQQYVSLVKLAAGLCRALPRIRPDAPRDASGRVLDSVMDPEELAGFGGIVGHHHVSRNKQDPGPAFAWEAFLEDVRGELGLPRASN